MKINDLLVLVEDIANTEISSGRYNHSLKDLHPKYDPDNTGSFSKVVADRDPHMVKKYGHKPLHSDNGMYSEDGFDAYINYLVKHDLMDNIHFPKVYQARRITDSRDAHINKYTMEKLIHPKTLTAQEWSAVEEHNFLPNALDEASAYEVAGTLEMAIRSQGSMNRTIKSDTLREALLIIREFVETERYQLDLHHENFMFRRTSTGLQIVITDPISFKA